MKKLIAFSLMAVASAAIAGDVIPANTIGIMEVNSSRTNTIVAVPYADFSVADKDAVVSNLVKTANLTAKTDTTQGDLLYVLSDTNFNYYCWELIEVGGVKIWDGKGSVIVNPDGTTDFTKAGPADTNTVARGNGIWLHRNSVTDPKIYIYGSDKEEAVVTTIAPGQKKLIAPSVYQSAAVAWWSKISGAKVGDEVMLMLDNGIKGSTKTYRYRDADPARWYKRTGSKWSQVGSGDELAVGQGMWYTATTDEDDRTVTW